MFYEIIKINKTESCLWTFYMYVYERRERIGFKANSVVIGETHCFYLNSSCALDEGISLDIILFSKWAVRFYSLITWYDLHRAIRYWNTLPRAGLVPSSCLLNSLKLNVYEATLDANKIVTMNPSNISRECMHPQYTCES